MNREEYIENLREEIKALKAANHDLQIHFDTMKAELETAKLKLPNSKPLRPGLQAIADQAAAIRAKAYSLTDAQMYVTDEN